MFGTDGHASVVTAYLSEAGPHSAAGLEARVSALADAGLDPGAARVTMARVDDEDWAESWKQHYQPLTVGHRLLIKPAWIDVASTERLIVELDPGMAFGTGYHPTTVLCLEALEDVVRPGHVVVDIGTGSGNIGHCSRAFGGGIGCRCGHGGRGGGSRTVEQLSQRRERHHYGQERKYGYRP